MLNEQPYAFAATLEDSDMAPTAQKITTFDSLHSQLQALLSEWSKVKADIDALRMHE